MEINELTAKFHAVGILLAQAESFPEAVESGSITVSGSLEEYLAAVKALGIAVVFVSQEKLVDDDFQYSADSDVEEYSNEEGDGAPGDDIHTQDLRAVNPELHLFKKYVGEIGRSTFFAPTSPTGLMFEIEQEWYGRFWESWQSAVNTLTEQSADEREALERDERRRRQELTAQLEALASDTKFVGLRTQRAMVAYAKDKIPELDELEPGDLRSAIADLKARIDARGT
jgi:hypothetical protein